VEPLRNATGARRERIVALDPAPLLNRSLSLPLYGAAPRSQYRDGRSAAPERATQLRRQANDALGYIHELGAQKALNAEFGGEKLTQRERIKRTAGMVGLNMDAEAQRLEAADAEAEARAADADR
jgi:hypothetical protein